MTDVYVKSRMRVRVCVCTHTHGCAHVFLYQNVKLRQPTWWREHVLQTEKSPFLNQRSPSVHFIFHSLSLLAETARADNEMYNDVIWGRVSVFQRTG